MPVLRHLNCLQALECAVRLGSQKAAAEELGITASAAGQRIRALEDYLGVELLVRGRAGVTPTAALAPALQQLRSGFEALESASESLRYSSHNTIRLSADTDWAALWLRPRLQRFLDAFPHYEVLLDTSSESARQDLRVREEDGASTGEPLYTDFLVPVCSPENYARIVDLPEGRKLEGFPLLHVDNDSGRECSWPRWVEKHGERQSGADRGVRYRSFETAVRAVRSNVGMLICGVSLVERELESGELLMPFGTGTGRWAKNACRLDWHAPALKKPSVRDFRDWLVAEGRRTRDWLGALVGEIPR